jgi:Rrf2 family nitric oxide-sensitive transcriptional repressor
MLLAPHDDRWAIADADSAVPEFKPPLRVSSRPSSSAQRMFSSTTEYALRASVFLASLNGDSASSERISEATKVPPGYISKVMRDLVVARLVESQRGPNGGFTLSRDPSSITVLDVVNAVTPIQRIESCPLGNPTHLNLCPLHRRLDDAIASIQEAFRKTTLAEVSTPHKPGAKSPQCAALTVSAAMRASTPVAVKDSATPKTKSAPKRKSSAP